METSLMAYLPEYFKEIRDFEALLVTETGEMEALALAMAQVRDNLYIQTMDDRALSEYETIFGIVPTVGAESMAFRRGRVLNRMSMQPPFTLRYLYGKLDQIIGKGKWSVSVDYPNSTLYIEAGAERQVWASEVRFTLNSIKPCHILYVSRPLLSASMEVSEKVALAEKTYHYHLGTWVLGDREFSSVVEKGEIATKENKTIDPRLLESVAAFTARDVAAVRINGDTVITGFELKSAQGNQAQFRYAVRADQASSVEKVELLNASGQVLTCAMVYVPIDDAVELTHKITVEEAG